MTDETEIDKDELKEQFGGTASRYEDDDSASAGSDVSADHTLDDPLAEAIREELLALDYPKLSVNDEVFAAAFRGCEVTDELDTLYGRFADHLGLPEPRRVDPADVTRSDVLQLALRVAFREGAPETHEKIREAKQAVEAQTL